MEKQDQQLLKISRKNALKKAYTENRQFSVMMLSQRYFHLTDDSSYNRRVKTASEWHTANQGPMWQLITQKEKCGVIMRNPCEDVDKTPLLLLTGVLNICINYTHSPLPDDAIYVWPL